MVDKSLLNFLLDQYKKIQLDPHETSTVTGRSAIMLAKDRMAGVGIEYIKIGKGKNAKVYYPLTAIVEYLENNKIKTA